MILLWWLLAMPAGAQVLLGVDVLSATGLKALKGKRVALLTNPSGVNAKGETTLSVLRRAPGVRLVALFAAEHGIYGTVPAGKEFANHTDSRTGLPVYSLYGPGPVRAPTRSMLQGIDILVYDIQDTGLRSYTYISTMGLAMEACGAAGVEFMVLDRPNPLGGLRVEGPMLNERFRSHVGQWKVPYIYGLTCGELARMINGEGWITHRCKLTVIPMMGWRRSMVWRDTRLAWVPTSPNVQAGDTPMYLAATGVLGELGGVNIGGGSPYRFQCVSAPWLDAARLSSTLNACELPGVGFRPFTYQKSNGDTIKAARIEFSNPSQAPLVGLNIHTWDAIRKNTGRDLFKEALKAGHNFIMFDKVMGTDEVRKAMERGKSARAITDSWKSGETGFRKLRQKYLIVAYNTPSSPSQPTRAQAKRSS